jgi:hypothetical protein
VPAAPTPAGAYRVLDLHNAYRARHHAPPLAWDASLAASAQAWADRCVFQHSGPGGELSVSVCVCWVLAVLRKLSATHTHTLTTRTLQHTTPLEHTQKTTKENLAMNFADWDAVAAAWYGEVAQYNYGAPGFSHATGHFTQMVWAASTALGCGVAPSCSLYVCHYAPPGNNVTGGQFEANVKAP